MYIYRTSRGVAAAGGGDRPSLWPRALRPERRATATAVAVAPATGKHFVSRNYCCAATVVAPGPTTTHTAYRIPHVNAPAVFAPLPPSPPSPSPAIFLSRFLTSPSVFRLTNVVPCFRRPSTVVRAPRQNASDFRVPDGRRHRSRPRFRYVPTNAINELWIIRRVCVCVKAATGRYITMSYPHERFNHI